MTARVTLNVVVLVLAAAGLVVWIMQARPTTSAVTAAVRPLPVLPVEVIGPETREILGRREMHGTLPVMAHPADPTRDNPFE